LGKIENMNRASADLLIKRARLAILVEWVITALHHFEGGLVYGTPNRTFAPLIFAIPLLITFGLLYVYKRTRQGFALALFSITTLLLWVGVIGLFEGGYNHTVKVAFYLTGVSPAVMERFFPSYEYVWPNDAFFETSGILTLIASYWPGLYTFRLIRNWRYEQRSREQQSVAPSVTIAGSIGIVALLIATPLLVVYMLTSQVSVLILALGMLAIAGTAVAWAVKQ
jgi:hypothetical protein